MLRMVLNKDEINKMMEQVNPLFRELYFMYIEDLQKMGKNIYYGNEQTMFAISNQSITKVIKKNCGFKNGKSK